VTARARIFVLTSVTAINFAWDGFFPRSDIEIDPEYFSGLLGARTKRIHSQLPN